MADWSTLNRRSLYGCKITSKGKKLYFRFNIISCESLGLDFYKDNANL